MAQSTDKTLKQLIINQIPRSVYNAKKAAGELDPEQVYLPAAPYDDSLGVTDAVPGKTIKVKAVQGGKPTAWETADIYEKPVGGIPKSDLADDVQTSLAKADTSISYDSQTLTEEQQKQARTNINVTKSYQIPTTTINDHEVRVDGWAAVSIGNGRPSGFSIILSDVLNGALPFFVANGTVFLCTGVDSSGAHKELTFVGFASSDLSAIAYKNARWEDGLKVIYIYPGSVNPNDIEERAQTAYFYVGSYGYIYGQHYEELVGDNPKYDIPKKYPFAVVDGKFNNAILPLIGIYEEIKQIVYARTDATPDGKFKIQGLIVGDKTTPFEVIDIDIPVYIKPVDGIPKSDLEQSVQTSLAKADTAISLGLTAATPGQIIKVKTVQDGKPTEWEAVDGEVPSVTASDNGKFLRVVSGAWTAVEIENANGGSF